MNKDTQTLVEGFSKKANEVLARMEKSAKCKGKDKTKKATIVKVSLPKKAQLNSTLADATLSLLGKKAMMPAGPGGPGGIDIKSLLVHGLAGAGMGALGGGASALFNRDRSLSSVLKGALGGGAAGGALTGSSDYISQILQLLQKRKAAPAAPAAPAPMAAPQAAAAKPAKQPGAGAATAAKAVSKPAPKPAEKPEAKPEKAEAIKSGAALMKFATDMAKATETEGGTLASASDTPARPVAEKKPEEKDSENESKKKGDE
jgi:hypothetical protein